MSFPDTTSSSFKESAESTFNNEIVKRRIYSTVVRSLIFQFAFIYLCGGLQGFAPWYPLQWISLPLLTVLRLSSWIYDFFIVSSVFLLGFIYSKQYRLCVTHPRNAFSTVAVNLLRTDALLSLFGHVFAGGMLAKAYLGLLGPKEYNGFSLICANFGVEWCVNEVHIFLVLAGCYSGLCIWWDYHMHNGNVLHFPIIQQNGSKYFRDRMLDTFVQTVIKVFLNLRWFYIFYVLLGHHVESFVANLLDMDLYGRLAELTFSAKLFEHLWIFCSCLMINAFITFQVDVLQAALNTSLTKRLFFSLETVHGFPSNTGKDECTPIKMLEAMESKNELLRYLAFQDFAHAAEQSQTRRADFFTLSQPGGHPRNWDKLVLKFLNLVDDFVKDLNASSKQSVTVRTQDRKTPQSARELGAQPLMFKPTTDRTVAVPSHANPEFSGVAPQPEGSNIAIRGLMSIWCKAVAITKEKLPSGSFLDSSVRSVYSRSIPVIWATKGMAYLVTNSITEDRYGVVQKDLSRILASMLTLLQTLERHKGMTATARKNRFETRDLQLKRDLHVTIKTAIYRICIGFGDHLSSINIPPELRSRLGSFGTFRES